MQSGGMKAWEGAAFTVICLLFDFGDCCAEAIGANEQSDNPVSSIIVYTCLTMRISVRPGCCESILVVPSLYIIPCR